MVYNIYIIKKGDKKMNGLVWLVFGIMVFDYVISHKMNK